MPKKNDNQVGESEGPIVGGGHQTREQAAIVAQGSGGRSDADRRREWSSGRESSGGHGPPAIGGSSEGHSDQIAGTGPREDRKVAGGLAEAERLHGDRAKERGR